MGATSTKIVKKFATSFSSSTPATDEHHNFHGGDFENTCMTAGPIVLLRQGSMYFDEDGDLAHEFYVEVLPQTKRGKPTMRRVTESLRPEGDVPHLFPRLHVDFPAVIYQVDY